MINAVHPALILFFGAAILPSLKEMIARKFFLLLIPVLAFVDLLFMKEGNYWTYDFLHYELVFGRIDRLSMCFAYVFVIVTFIGMVYSLHVRERGQHAAALIYAGSALGVTFAGDFITLFAFWESMAVSSVFLILYQKSDAALKSSFRYLMVHLFGGACLLAGIILYVGETGSAQFSLVKFGNLSSCLILLGFIINAAVPPFSAWLSDSYPEATVTGAVFLTAFTTKSAVYVLLRGFPGVELLAWLGAIMAIYGITYAVLENNIRRLLAYHIISQVGYMVCGVGLGTALSLNGSAAHAFTHILYKALLFMGAGAVIEVTGKTKMTDLRGRDLYKKMPVCLSLYMVGALSISAVPLFNGFISKPMIIYATGELHKPIMHLLLHLASVGTFVSVALKLPHNTWFGEKHGKTDDNVITAKEPPLNMLIAMGIAAFLCIFTGVYPKALYDLLPFDASFRPYDPYLVLSSLQYMLFALLAFVLFIHRVEAKPFISLDTDWFYRKGGPVFMRFCEAFTDLRSTVQAQVSRAVKFVTRFGMNPQHSLYAFFSGKKSSLVPYSADKYRQPIGVGVLFFLIIFSLYCAFFLNE